jgi:hypothetical protein
MTRLWFDPYREWLGVEPGQQPLDHYRLLGLPAFEDRSEVIAQAADERLTHVRGFQSGPRAAATQEVLDRLAAAKLCLLNPATKTAYDALLHGQSVARPAAVAAPPVDPARAAPPPVAVAAGAAPPAPSEALPAEADSSGLPATSKWRVAVVAGGTVAMVVGLGWAAAEFGPRWLPLRSADPPTSDAVVTPAVDPPPKKKEPPPRRSGPIVRQRPDGSVYLEPKLAVIEGHAAARISTAIGRWSKDSPGSVTWDFAIEEPGFFEIYVTYASAVEVGEFVLVFDGQDERRGKVRNTGGWNINQTDPLTAVAVRQAGRHVLAMKVKDVPGDDWMTLKAIVLSPIEAAPPEKGPPEKGPPPKGENKPDGKPDNKPDSNSDGKPGSKAEAAPSK